MDYKKITNVEIENIITSDYPDFVDAFISHAEYEGRELTEDELNKLNENTDFVYDAIINTLY